MDDVERVVEELTKRAADDGRLIELGWLALRAMWVPKDAGPDQIRDLRWAFMAGAQHLFSSLVTVLDPEEEPTDADMRKMDQIAAELEAFATEAETAALDSHPGRAG